MSEYGASSSDLTDIEDGAALKSDPGSNHTEHEHDTDQDADSAPETEAETERLEDSPQKRQSANGLTDAALQSSPLTHPAEQSNDTPQPTGGLTAQDILGDGPATSDDDKDLSARPSSKRNKPSSPRELAGNKRKRPASISAHTDGPAGSPPKKRSTSMRLDRKLLDKQSQSSPPLVQHDTENAVMEDSSADEGDELENGAPDTSQANTPHPADEEEEEEEEEEEAPLNELADGEADATGADEEMPDAEIDTTAKTEDELAKKKIAMDALRPIEKKFAIFRDKIYDERWAELNAELELLNNPNTTHADYLAMRQALDARAEEKKHLEQVIFSCKVNALETKISAQRAAIHAQYFQTVRQIREDYMDKLNEQFSQIQRERRLFKTKEAPNFTYNFDPRRSKQIAHQTAYNTEVSLLSGIAQHLGFPAAPEMRPATQQDIDDDLRAMKIPSIKPQARPLSSQIGRAEEAATDEQFLEKNPWANPQHPANQQARRNYLDATARPLPAGSAPTIGAPSDGLGHPDGVPNGSSPAEQLKRGEEDGQATDQVFLSAPHTTPPFSQIMTS